MMKNIALLLLLGFLLACNTGIEKDKNTAVRPIAENHAEHAPKASALSLNKGAKWKADSNTLVNIALLQDIASNAKKENLENYLQTANFLQEGLNKMLSECKMKGENHEALHMWLEPLMELINDFNNATTLEIAEISLYEIRNQINLFSQYFEE